MCPDVGNPENEMPVNSRQIPLHLEPRFPMRTHGHLCRLVMALLISIGLNVTLIAVDFSIDPRRAELSRIQRWAVLLLSPAEALTMGFAPGHGGAPDSGACGVLCDCLCHHSLGGAQPTCGVAAQSIADYKQTGLWERGQLAKNRLLTRNLFPTRPRVDRSFPQQKSHLM